MWLPALSDDVVKVADPLLSVPDPMLTPPSRKAIDPVGVPCPGDVTAIVAVNVTGLPISAGLLDAARVRVVLAAFTACGSVDDEPAE